MRVNELFLSVTGAQANNPPILNHLHIPLAFQTRRIWDGRSRTHVHRVTAIWP